MALVLRRPFNEMPSFFGDDDWFFPVFSKKSTEPDMDVYENEKEVIAEINLPDINPDDVKISVEGDVLKISGEKEEKEEEDEKNYWRKEIRKGSL